MGHSCAKTVDHVRMSSNDNTTNYHVGTTQFSLVTFKTFPSELYKVKIQFDTIHKHERKTLAIQTATKTYQGHCKLLS